MSDLNSPCGLSGTFRGVLGSAGVQNACKTRVAIIALSRIFFFFQRNLMLSKYGMCSLFFFAISLNYFRRRIPPRASSASPSGLVRVDKLSFGFLHLHRLISRACFSSVGLIVTLKFRRKESMGSLGPLFSPRDVSFTTVKNSIDSEVPKEVSAKGNVRVRVISREMIRRSRKREGKLGVACN